MLTRIRIENRRKKPFSFIAASMKHWSISYPRREPEKLASLHSDSSQSLKGYWRCNPDPEDEKCPLSGTDICYWFGSYVIHDSSNHEREMRKQTVVLYNMFSAYPSCETHY